MTICSLYYVKPVVKGKRDEEAGNILCMMNQMYTDWKILI